MAEKSSRLKQYDYKATSNLVLHSAERDRRISEEPSGEAESLYGKLGKSRMGDRAIQTKDKDLEERKKKMKEFNKKKVEEQKRKKQKLGPGSGYASSFEQVSGGYRPKTKETRYAYEELLQFVQEALGDQ